MNPHLPSADPDRTAARAPSADPQTVDATADSTRPRLPDPPAGAPTIPGYVITSEIAKGGMGRVYAGIDLTLDREVAIKTLLPGANADRFVTESKITARLPHPNIPPVYALGTLADGSPFLAMKYIHGQTLSEQLKARTSPRHDLPRFVQVFEQIAQAVGFAHSRGIIHRDLKPLNVMVGEFGEVQVMDWGLAKVAGGRAGVREDPVADGNRNLTDPDSPGTDHTRAGAVMGTPGYMAPEQARGEAVDARADVFALGSMLATILTGRPAFVGTDSRDTVQKAANAELSDVLTRLDGSGADADLITLAKLCLSVNLADRPEDGQVVAAEVGAYRAGVEARLRRAETERAAAVVRAAETRKRQRVIVWSSGITVGILLAGVVGVALALLEAQRQEGIAKGQTAAKEQALEEKTVALDEKTVALSEKTAALSERTAALAESEASRDQLLGGLDSLTSSITGASLFTQKGLTEEQKRFLSSVLSQYRALAAKAGNDEKTRLRSAQATERVGIIEYRLGRRKEARVAFEEAVRQYAALAADFSAVAAYRHSASVSRVHLGNVLAYSEELKLAEEQYRLAVTVQEAFTTEFPDQQQARADLGRSRLSLGMLLGKLGRHAEGAEECEKGVAMHEKLAADFPAVMEFRIDLPQSHTRLANVLFGWGKLVAAEQHYRKGLALQEKLAADFPTDADHRAELAGVYANFGVLLKGQSRWEEAEKVYAKGHALLVRLAADYPAMTEYQALLAHCHTQLGSLLSAQGSGPTAEEQFRKALAILSRLSTDFPAIPFHRDALAHCHNSLATLLSEMGKASAATSECRKAVALAERLVADFPTAPEYRDFLAIAHTNLGMLLDRLGKVTEAEDEFRKGLALGERLVADHPAVPEYRLSLANAHKSLALLLRQRERLTEAETEYKEGLALLEKLATESPAVTEYRVELAGGYCNFGHLERDTGRAAASLARYDRAIELLQVVCKADPKNQTAKMFLRNSHHGRALSYDVLAKFPDAVKAWDKVIELSPREEYPIHAAQRAMSRVNAGQVAEGVAEVATLRKLPGWTDEFLHLFACVYSVASDKIADEKQNYADRAMELLTKAVKAGFNDAAGLKADKRFDPIRGRDDFKKLLADLEAKTPPRK